MDLHDGHRKAIHGRIIRLLGERSQAWLAEKSGISTSTLSHQLTTQRFTLELLIAIAEPLGVDVGYLIRGDPAEAAPILPNVAVELVHRIEDEIRRARADSATAAPAGAASPGDRRVGAARKLRAKARKRTRDASG